MEFARKAFFSPREYAELAGIDPSTVLDHIHRGRLYAVKLSERLYRIPLATVMSTLYPDQVGRPRFRTSRDARTAADRDRRRDSAEGKLPTLRRA